MNRWLAIAIPLTLIASAGCNQTAGGTCRYSDPRGDLTAISTARLWDMIYGFEDCAAPTEREDKEVVFRELIRRGDARAMYELSLDGEYARDGDRDESQRLLETSARLGYAPAVRHLKDRERRHGPRRANS